MNRDPDIARRGRREDTLDAALPAHRLALAARLRGLRRECGHPPYRTLGRLAHCGSGTLSEAASGRRFPTWETVRGYVTGCLHHAGRAADVDRLLPQWRRAWEDADVRERAHPARHHRGPDELPEYERDGSAVSGHVNACDARAVLAALAAARAPLTRDDLAEVLGWSLARAADALEYAAAQPDLAGPLALRRTPPNGHVLGLRLDTLTAEQHANIADLAHDRDPFTANELAALQAIFTVGWLTAYESLARAQRTDANTG